MRKKHENNAKKWICSIWMGKVVLAEIDGRLTDKLFVVDNDLLSRDQRSAINFDTNLSKDDQRLSGNRAEAINKAIEKSQAAIARARTVIEDEEKFIVLLSAARGAVPA